MRGRGETARVLAEVAGLTLAMVGELLEWADATPQGRHEHGSETCSSRSLAGQPPCPGMGEVVRGKAIAPLRSPAIPARVDRSGSDKLASRLKQSRSGV